MGIHIGVGGWTYEPWRGPFYPAGLPQKRELEYAGQQLTGIEINGTYYGSQKPESFANWAASNAALRRSLSLMPRTPAVSLTRPRPDLAVSSTSRPPPASGLPLEATRTSFTRT